MGSVSGLASLSVTAVTTYLASSVTMADVAGNNIGITGNVYLIGDVTLTTDGASHDGAVAITGTINADTVANRRRLTVVAGSGTIDNGSGGPGVRSAAHGPWAR